MRHEQSRDSQVLNLRHFFGRLTLLCLILGALCMGGFRVQGCNIYFPADSAFSDEDLLIFGDGDPVCMTLSEWKAIYGLHDELEGAAAFLRRPAVAATPKPALDRDGFPGRSPVINAVPEPKGLSLVVCALFAMFFRNRPSVFRRQC